VKIRAFVLALAVALSVTLAAAAPTFDTKPFSHMADVEAARDNTMFRQLVLPPAVLDIADPSLADLRLVNAAGDIEPYVVKTLRREKVVSKYTATLTNRTYDPGRSVRVDATFHGRAEKNVLEIKTNSQVYKRRALIESSADGRHWRYVTEGYLFDVRGGSGDGFVKNRIAIPTHTDDHFRITVFHDVDDASRVDISSVAAFRQSTQGVEPQAIIPILQKRVEVEKERETHLYLDLRHANLAWREIVLDVLEGEFSRRCTVLGRSTEIMTVTRRGEDGYEKKVEKETPWQTVYQGALYRLPRREGSEEHLALPLSGRQFRYLLIKIENRDDKPLAVTPAEARFSPIAIRFKGQSGEAFQLYFGWPAGKTPRYDLSKYADSLAEKGLGEAVLANVRANPQYEAEPKPALDWHERYRVLIWLALLAALGVLAFLTLQQVRRAKADS